MLRMEKKTPGRNEPCWCGSGKKFKKCHYVREFEATTSAFDFDKVSRRRWQAGNCLHPMASSEGCAGRAIQSHTLQRNGGLAKLADASNHVLTTKFNFDAIAKAQGNPGPVRIGLRKASTFPGFCSKHDAEFFGPIENETLDVTADAAFRFAFRSISLEHFNKLKSLELLDDLRRKADAGRSRLEQLAIQSFLSDAMLGHEKGLDDTSSTKSAYDASYCSGLFAKEIHYRAIWFDGIIPIAASFAFIPEFDFAGKRLQSLMDFSRKLEHITVNITAFGNRTLLLFAWLGSSDGYAKSFVDSFLTLPKEEMSNTLVWSCFELAENLYISPEWWELLPSAQKNKLNRKIKNGTSEAERTPAGLISDGYAYSTALPTAFCS